MADSIKLRITGDDSAYRKTLNSVEKTARQAVASLAREYQRAGENQSSAMKRAWEEVKQAYANGTTVMIGDTEVVIRSNQRLENSIKDVANDALPEFERESGSTSRSVRDDFERIGDTAESSGRRIRSAFSATIKGITVASAAVSAAWSAVGVVGVRYNAQIEQLQTSFEVMTGSAEKGAAVLERIRQIAAATPFETEGLASTVQLLMNYNLTADEAINSMEMLGDISQGNQDKLSRIAMAYGQMSSAGKVMLEDVKQMTEAGFNPLAEISETTGESMASLYDRISKGTLAVDEITASMVRATSEGGKYFQSMEKQSQTLNGQLSTLKDNAMSLLGDVMTPLTDELRDSMLPMANELLGEFATAFEQGGFDGLLDAITGKVPDLLNAAVGMGEKVVAGLAKWLPGAMQQIASVLPNALRSVLDMGPQLVSALFDVVSGLVRDLITMLPELVPMIVNGIGDMLKSVASGIGSLVEGVFDGINDVFLDIGLREETLEESINRLFSNVDSEKVKELRGIWEATIDTEVNVGDYQAEIDDAINTIKNALLNIPGLTSAESAQILDAIVNGSGLDLLEDVLKDKGIPAADITSVVLTISNAKTTISNAVNGLGLSDSAKAHIAEIAADGGSASEVSEALQGYGIDANVANDTAKTITDGMAEINVAAEGIGLDAATRGQLMLGAIVDRGLVIASLLALGAPQGTIDTVNASYDTVTNTLHGRLTAAINSAYEALTDGESDTPTVMSEIENKIQDAYDDAVETINDWIEDKIAELDPNSEDYETKVAEIQATGQNSINQVTGYQAAMWAIIAGLANASVAEVNAAWGRVEELLAQTQTTVAQFEELEGRVNEQNETDVALTRAGAVRESNQDIAARAFAYTMQQNMLSKEAIESYKKEQEETLAAAFRETGDLEAYNAGMDALESELATRNEQRIALYASNMQQLVNGLILSLEETQPEVAQALRDIIDPNSVANELNTAISALNAGEIDASDLTDGVVRAINEAVGGDWTAEDLLSLSDEDLSGRLQAALRAWTANAEETLSAEDIDLGWIGPIMQTALQEGAFNDFSPEGINTDNMAEALYDLGEASGEGLAEGIEASAGGAETAAGNMAQGSIDSAAATLDSHSPSRKFYNLGVYAGQGLVNGLNSKYGAVYAAARRLAQAAESGARITLRISSPSKVFEELGLFTGEGFLVGYEKSIREAQRTVRGLTSGLVSAATLPAQRMTIAQSAQTTGADGDDLSRLNVGLYISDRKIAEATADASARVSNARSKRLAAGWGHAQ